MNEITIQIALSFPFEFLAYEMRRYLQKYEEDPSKDNLESLEVQARIFVIATMLKNHSITAEDLRNALRKAEAINNLFISNGKN